MKLPIKQILLEMAMDQYQYLGSTTANKDGKHRHIYGVSGSGNDYGLKTILYQSTGSQSNQPGKFFGTTGINYDSEIKEFSPLINRDPNMGNNWIQKYSLIGKLNGEKFQSLENGLNKYNNTKLINNLDNDHLKVKEARNYMEQLNPKIENIKVLSSGNINKVVRNFLKEGK